VSVINAQITEHAEVLNTQSVTNGVVVSLDGGEGEIATMVKRFGGATYLFAVEMTGQPTTTTAQFTLTCVVPTADAIVSGEDRSVKLAGSVLTDDFAPYEVHMYEIR
jgi:hypothetical protein